MCRLPPGRHHLPRHPAAHDGALRLPLGHWSGAKTSFIWRAFLLGNFPKRGRMFLLCHFGNLTLDTLAVGQNQGYHFGVGAPPILVYFSWDWDVHWGYDLDFDPWPYVCTFSRVKGMPTPDWGNRDSYFHSTDVSK